MWEMVAKLGKLMINKTKWALVLCVLLLHSCEDKFPVDGSNFSDGIKYSLAGPVEIHSCIWTEVYYNSNGTVFKVGIWGNGVTSRQSVVFVYDIDKDEIGWLEAHSELVVIDRWRDHIHKTITIHTSPFNIKRMDTGC